MKADDPIIVNLVQTTPINVVAQVLYSVITIMIEGTKDKTKKEYLEILRQMVNEYNWNEGRR